MPVARTHTEAGLVVSKPVGNRHPRLPPGTQRTLHNEREPISKLHNLDCSVDRASMSRLTMSTSVYYYIQGTSKRGSDIMLSSHEVSIFS